MKTYSIWMGLTGNASTMVEGQDPPKFANGTLQPNCEIFVDWFEADSNQEALDMRDLLMKEMQ